MLVVRLHLVHEAVVDLDRVPEVLGGPRSVMARPARAAAGSAKSNATLLRAAAIQTGRWFLRKLASELA